MSPELYQQMLAKALSHDFGAKLLLLDVTDFSLKVGLENQFIFIFESNCFIIYLLLIYLCFFLQFQSKYGNVNKPSVRLE